MKIAILLILMATNALAALGDVTASFSAPASFPLALEKGAAEDSLYVFCNTPPFLIWRVNALTGSLVASYPSPRGTQTRGLSWLGADLIAGDDYNHYVYRFTSSNGSVLSSWAAGHDVQGLANDGILGSGNRLFITSAFIFRRLWFHTTSGSVLASFLVDANTDCAWDYTNNLVWINNTDDDCVNGYNTAGSLIASFEAPAVDPVGLAYYQSYLWLGTTTDTHRIWRLDCPSITRVNPSSLSRIKILYR